MRSCIRQSPKVTVASAREMFISDVNLKGMTALLHQISRVPATFPSVALPFLGCSPVTGRRKEEQGWAEPFFLKDIIWNLQSSPSLFHTWPHLTVKVMGYVVFILGPT